MLIINLFNFFYKNIGSFTKVLKKYISDIKNDSSYLVTTNKPSSSFFNIFQSGTKNSNIS